MQSYLAEACSGKVRLGYAIYQRHVQVQMKVEVYNRGVFRLGQIRSKPKPILPNLALPEHACAILSPFHRHLNTPLLSSFA